MSDSGVLDDERILIVEDEMLVMMPIEDMIGDLGGHVAATVSTLTQALAALVSTHTRLRT